MSDSASILLFFAGIGLGLAGGFAIGAWRGFTWGVAAGCLVIGLGGTIAAGSMAWQRWQFRTGSALVEGRLVAQSRGPEVLFRAADGSVHRVHGLQGSQSDRQPGDAVPVRYRPDDPARAVIADVQNEWGGVIAFGLFGALPLAFGAFFLALSVHERREAGGSGGRRPGRRVERSLVQRAGRSVERTAWRTEERFDEPRAGAGGTRRDRLAQNFVIAGNVVMWTGVGFAVFAHDGIGELGRAFALIGLGAALFGVAALLRRDGDWQAPAIAFIVALGFVLFGGGAMLLAPR